MVSTKSPHLKVQVWIYRRSAPAGVGLEVLILRTQPERGDFWQPVTGGVEPGETVEQAALREATEETGLAYAGPLRFLGEFSFQSRWGGQVHESCYALEAPSSADLIRLDPREHQAFAWVGAEEARGRLRYPSNVSMLESLLRLESRGSQF